jgi:hypothetical protein
VFKTSLAGQALIMSLDPEFNRFIFQQEGKLCTIWYPETANNIFCEKSLTAFSDTIHKFIQSFASKLLSTENLR